MHWKNEIHKCIGKMKYTNALQQSNTQMHLKNEIHKCIGKMKYTNALEK